MESIYKKAYKEVFVILNNCSKDDYEKIPQKIIKQIELNMDKDYEYKLNEDFNIETQPMLKETLALLAIIYRDYWATEAQKKEIIKSQNLERQMLEDEKRLKYNTDIFKNKIEKQNEQVAEEVSMIEYKEDNFIKKLWRRIKKFFTLG